jgi:hypothetical protein
MDPLDPGDALDDPDGDGLINVEEFEHGSDPNNPDSDADGLPDGWEVENYLDPADPSDAHMDFDYLDDGSQEDAEEYAFYSVEPHPYDNYDEY